MNDQEMHEYDELSDTIAHTTGQKAEDCAKDAGHNPVFAAINAVNAAMHPKCYAKAKEYEWSQVYKLEDMLIGEKWIVLRGVELATAIYIDGELVEVFDVDS